MLSVAVHKDIAEYQPKLVGKMTQRTLICIVGALGVGIFTGLYMWFVLGIEVQDNMLLIYAVTTPFWLCGFFRPKGMVFERWFFLWLKFKFGNNKVFYEPSMMKIGLVGRVDGSKKKKGKVYGKVYRKFLQSKAIEAYCPGD